LEVKRKKERQMGVKVELNENETPCYYLFAFDGRPPVMVTKSGLETRDKSTWFLTEQEALEAKKKSLSSKRKKLENELKNAEKNDKEPDSEE
jgi:hypothetical protein